MTHTTKKTPGVKIGTKRKPAHKLRTIYRAIMLTESESAQIDADMEAADEFNFSVYCRGKLLKK